MSAAIALSKAVMIDFATKGAENVNVGAIPPLNIGEKLHGCNVWQK